MRTLICLQKYFSEPTHTMFFTQFDDLKYFLHLNYTFENIVN